MSVMFIFAHGGVQYGIPVMEVLEIVEMPKLLPAHVTIPGFLGNSSHRGYLLPILDPTELSSGRACAPASLFVIVRSDGVVFGLAMDSFVSVANLDSDASGGELVEQTGTFVERARAYLGNALLHLSISAIVRLVRQHFAQQEYRHSSSDLTPGGGHEAAAEVFLCVRLDEVHFAIPIQSILEIVEGSELTPLFKVPPIIRGLTNLRGQVLACLDISTELGLQAREIGERSQLVILKFEDAELALCVDKVTGIRRLNTGRLQKADLVLPGDMHRLATSVHEGEDGTLLILSVGGVFEAPALLPYRGADV